ncbi:response regulator [Ktedonosporobacter rubrisoli]|uniref:Response regulator n=1 Tax=Ktedonosporobacter rubrisoli TaxID=2509675 RepID=A0A4P6K2L8_KTERU|nr:response regulator [Ktedonosporobacter rubrisoli]QBD82384.1 response regulator [Ktedonosporobacter rubrisoli]
MMVQWRPLRVIIVGPQNTFSRVLATNIQYWGYEVVMLAAPRAIFDDGTRAMQGDVVLYDLDEVFPTFSRERDFPEMWPERGTANSSEEAEGQETHAPFIIAISSRSVSRVTLERIGAIALLQKSFFKMSWLQRYLKVLQRLTSPEGEALPQQYKQDENIRVLVVDDNEDIASTIQQCLIYESGYEVAVAHDGLDALELYLDWHPQCIVTDLLMPWMNGYQVMRCLALGTARGAPAFVVMSALNQLEVPIGSSYLRGKAVAYVNKPFNIDHLLSAIKQVCAG